MTKKKSEASNTKVIQALSKISKAIASDLYLEDILKLMVVVTAEVMNSEICSLWILDEKGKELKLRATQAIDKEYIKERCKKFTIKLIRTNE